MAYDTRLSVYLDGGLEQEFGAKDWRTAQVVTNDGGSIITPAKCRSCSGC